MSALRLQRSFRYRKHRADFERHKAFQTAKDKRRQEALLKILTKLRCANARSGRILVALNIVYPRYVPDMPEVPIVPKWFTEMMARRALEKVRDAELAELRKKRYYKLLHLKRGAIANSGMIDLDDPILRWRHRTPIRRLFWYFREILAKKYTTPLAERLERKADAMLPSCKRSTVMVLANVVGAREWKRTNLERRVWAQGLLLTALRGSDHCRANGYVFYHGMWEEGVPHGRGWAAFPPAKMYDKNGVINQYQDYDEYDEEEEKEKEEKHAGEGEEGNEIEEAALQYDIIEGDFSFGNLVVGSHVRIQYREGGEYAGPYVRERVYDEDPDDAPESEKSPSHNGVFKVKGVGQFSGFSVDNHFNPKSINGSYRIEYDSGDTYEGEMLDGKPHGTGTYAYKEAKASYTGEWVEGKRHGRGTHTLLKTGHAYCGMWENDEKEGYGEQTFDDGSKYCGGYHESMWHGEGKLEFADGGVYEGGFFESSYQGQGLMRYADGASYDGSFKAGKRQTARKVNAIYINAAGDRFEVPFDCDEMHGRGVLFENQPSGWCLEKYGLWEHGKVKRWIGTGINEGATREFCSKFQTYYDYTGLFAMVLSQDLPKVPPGVDPTDRSVEQHVFGVLAECGPLAGADIIDRCEEERLLLLPEYEQSKKELEMAKVALEEAEDEFEDQEAIVEESKEVVDELQVKIAEVEHKVADFWEKDLSRTRDAYLDIVDVLKATDHHEWFTLKQVRKLPDVLRNLYTAICLLYDIDMKNPRQFKMILQNNKLNEDLGDKNALIREYDVKLLDEIDRWDVYKCSKTTAVDRVSPMVFDPKMKKNNLELSDIAPVASHLVVFMKAAYAYAKRARDIAPSVIALKEMKARLLHHTEIFDEEVEFRDEAEKKVKERESALDMCDAQHEEHDLHLKELNATLSTAREYLRIATKRKIAKAALIEKRKVRVAQGLPPDDPLDIDVWAMFCNPNKATLIHDLNDPIVPWISREEEALRNTVASALQEQVDIIVSVEPEIWDCMTTMKELIVGREVCKKKHGYHVEPETLDAIFDMQDAVSGGIDPAIADALGIVIDGVAGIPREVHDALDEMVGIVSRRQAREKMNANRIKTYLNRQVMVLASPTDESGFRGKCIRTYIKVTRVHPDPLLGLSTSTVYTV